MNRIDELITELCPEGVEFMGLGDIAEFKRGTQLKINDLVPGPYPVVTASRSENVSHFQWNYDPESVTVTSHGAYAGHVNFWETPIWLANNVFLLLPSSVILPRYLYFFLKNNERSLRSTSQGGGVPYINVRDIAPFRIPVPPLEVQREIVKVLDTFTKLEAELEAELEARRRQYQYYRDTLLAFGDQDVRWATMAEVGVFFRGRRFTKNDFNAEGVACIHYGDIYTQYGTAATETVSRVRSNMVSTLRFAKPGDLVIAGVGETVEDVGKAVAWLGNGDAAIHDDCFAFRHSLNPKFVSYYFQTAAFHAEKNKFVARAKVKRLSSESLGKLTIPVPPLDEQERIVAILDKLDTLVNDLSIGLPAVIKARRQQYEHYRDRLLCFREAA
ncbi:MAG: restriction endonuclease subunit S [Oryzomonas sp.]